MDVTTTRVALFAGLAMVMAGCAMGRLTELEPRGSGEDGSGPDDAAPGDWALSIDAEGSDAYLGLAEETADVIGTLSASRGPGRVEIAGAPMSVGAGGDFGATVAVDPGLSLVTVEGFDADGHVVRQHQSVLRASYVEEGAWSANAAVAAVSPELLAALASGAAGALSGLDLSSFAAPGTVLIDGSPCTLYVDRVSHAAPTLSLEATDDGRLRATARLRDITVGFHGRCSGLGLDVAVREGSEADETTVEVSMILEPILPADGGCISGFSARDTRVAITSFDLDLRLGGCGLLCLFGEVIGEVAEGAVKGMLEDRLSGEVDGLVGGALMGLDLFGDPATLDFMETPVEVGLCLTDLGPEDGALTARLGTRVTGPGGGGHLAPGAPSLPPTLTSRTPGSLYLDPGLVGQILYAVWNAGALSVPDVAALADGDGGVAFTVSSLTPIVPQLRELVRDGTLSESDALQIGMDATMAPLVRGASPEESAAGADVLIEIGELTLQIGAGGAPLFELTTEVRVALSLSATPDGRLQPTVVPSLSSTHTWLTWTALPQLPERSASGLADLVDGLLLAQLAPLLEGAAFELPDLGGPLTVADVAPDAGGYLELQLSPPTGP